MSAELAAVFWYQNLKETAFLATSYSKHIRMLAAIILYKLKQDLSDFGKHKKWLFFTPIYQYTGIRFNL